MYVMLECAFPRGVSPIGSWRLSEGRGPAWHPCGTARVQSFRGIACRVVFRGASFSLPEGDRPYRERLVMTAGSHQQRCPGESDDLRDDSS